MKPKHTVGNMKTITAIVDGKTVTVGDNVDFKSDVEQWGTIASIKSVPGMGKMLTLKAPDDAGFEGDYIGGEDTTTVSARECWVDD